MQAIPSTTRDDPASSSSLPGTLELLGSLDGGEVHVWTLPPNQADASEGALAMLDPQERDRALRLRSDADRAKFVSHHAFARRVLARYLGMAPTAIDIRAAGNGKPEVDPGLVIAFNTSRSGGLSVVTVARRPVGVDVERVRPIDDALEVADGLFADGERRMLQGVPSAFRSSAFLALWTRKESVVKAIGAGLSQPLDAFDVSEAAGDGSGRWRLRLGSHQLVVAQLVMPTGWVGAVSTIGTQLDIRSIRPTHFSR